MRISDWSSDVCSSDLSGQIAMVYYSYRGQEIIPSVMGEVLRDDDTICTIYRGIHDMLGKGFPLRELWAELAGRTTGSCKGKGGQIGRASCRDRVCQYV